MKRKTQVFSVIIFLFIVSISSAVLSSFTFGQRSNIRTGLTFHTINNHDGIWHLALMESLTHGIPPENPLIRGEKMVGYHYLNDALFVLIHFLTGISLPTLYLRVMPVVLAALFATTTLLLFLQLFPRKVTAYLGATITVLGANFAYLVPLFSPSSKADQSAFWLDQTIHLGVNQQLLLSLSIGNIILLLFLWNAKKYWWLIGFLVAGLVAIKIYGAMLFLPALVIIGTLRYLHKKEWQLLGAVGIAVVIAVPLLQIIGNKNGFPFFWEPGWFFRTMFESGDRLNFPRWEMMRLAAAQRGDIFRQILLWMIAIVVFFVGNFGIKILGIFALPKMLKKKFDDTKYFWVLLALIILESFIAVFFFLQKGVAWNTIQFLNYAQVPLGILFTQFVVSLRRLKFPEIILAIALLLMLPSTIQTFVSDLRPESYIFHPPSETLALNSLRTSYLDKELLVGSSLNTNSIVPALSGRPVYWADDGVLIVTNNLHQERKTYVEDVETGHVSCQPNQILLEGEKGIIQIFPCPLTTLPFMCRSAQ